MRRIAAIMFTFLSIITSSFSQSDNSESLKAWSKYDFIPGDKIIFEDNLAGETVGEFPSKWKLIKGSGENMIFRDSIVLSFGKSAEVEPRMKKINFLPALFTIEFDLYLHGKGNEAYAVIFDKPGKLDLRSNKVEINQFTAANSLSQKVGWQHIAIVFNDRTFKVYWNERKLLNVPDIGAQPAKFSITALSHGALTGYPSFIRNIRVAEGGSDLYKRVTTEGKFITRGILFDVNKWIIRPESMGVLNEITNMMKLHNQLKFSVEGHTDGDGEDATNKILSEKRADAVKKVLVESGIAADRLTTKGWGESKPSDQNNTPEGKSNNRRVEFIKI